MLAAVTTEEDGARRAFVDYIVGIAGSIEGVARCEPIEGELGVTLLLERDVGAGEGGANGEGVRAYLGNLFDETRALPPEAIEGRCRHFLQGMLSAAQELPDWEGARERIFVAIRSLGYFHSLGGADVIARRSLPMLAECVVLDLGEAITYVTASLAEKWGKSLDELFDVARSNVETRLEHDLQPEGDDQPAKIYRLASGDSFESSRLGSLAWLTQARTALETDGMVCAIPERDTLLLAVDVSPPTLVRMAELAEQIYVGSSRGISPALYVFTPDGELGPLEMVDDHPLRERIRRGHLMLADVEYGSQKIAIDAATAGREPPLFVASYFAVEREGTVFSYATWAQGVEALLPLVDFMAFTFIDEERGPLLVPLAVVAELANDLLEEVPELEPVRYRTLGFPSDELVERLAMYAVET
jgi:uncharacterized protein YtpQ (UPF0354 family)